MKNLTKLAFLFLVTIFLFSCSREDDSQKTIVGKWEFSKKISYDELGKEIVSDYENRCSSSKDNIVIESNNSYTETISNSDCEPQINKTNYTYNNSDIALYGFTYKLKVVSLTSTEMRIQYINTATSKAYQTRTFILIRK